MSNIAGNRVICPYCGYRLPIEYSRSANCREISVKCKGSHCRKIFNLIIEDGVQKNLVPNSETVRVFQAMFPDDYKRQILEMLGVEI